MNIDYTSYPTDLNETMQEYRSRIRTIVGESVPTFMIDRMYKQNRWSRVLNSARNVEDLKNFFRLLIKEVPL